MAKKGGAPTKSEVLTQISKDTSLSRKQVGAVFDSLGGVIKKSLRGNGLFTLPGLLKLKVVKKPATKTREGINPFTGEKMTFKAKPASKKVRVLPLKSLKAMVNSEGLSALVFRPGRPVLRLPAAMNPAGSVLLAGFVFGGLVQPAESRRMNASTSLRRSCSRP